MSGMLVRMDELRDRYRSPSDVVDRLVQLRRQVSHRWGQIDRHIRANRALLEEIRERETEITALKEIEAELNDRLS